MTSKKLLDVALALNSPKKKEKLEALESLCALLNQEGVTEALHQNSVAENKVISWDILFIRVHNTALFLIDNSSQSKPLTDKFVENIKHVVLLVIQKSLQQKILSIDSNIITSSIIAVFESELRVKWLGSTYLSIFYKYVMTERRNWAELRKENWIGIKNICKNHINNLPPGTQSITFVEILCHVIKNSSKNCQVSTYFLDLFDFVQDVFVSYKGLGPNFEIFLLHLTNILCLQLAVEFRYRVCQFMEDIFDFVISFHNKNNSDLNILVYHFLMTTLCVHNPYGIGEDNKSAYAYDLGRWKSQIKKLYILCQGDVKEIIKNSVTVNVEIELMDLFVDASHLVTSYGFRNCSEVCDLDTSYSDPGGNNKRKCSVDKSNQNVGKLKFPKLDSDFGNLLINLQTKTAWFWLQFLELLVRKYPKDIKNYYPDIIKVLCKSLNDMQDTETVKVLLRCLRYIIEAETFLELSESEIHRLNDTWNKMTQEFLRVLHSNTGEISSETHALLQTLIKHSKLRDPTPLIKLYCNGTLNSNENNFKTLSVICHNCILPEFVINENEMENQDENENSSQDNVRVCLLKWLLKGKDKHPCEDLAKVLVALIFKKFEEDSVKAVDKDETLLVHTSINDFCKLIINNYKTVAFENLKLGPPSRKTENNGLLRVDFTTKKKLFDFLSKRWKYLSDCLNNKKQLDFGEQLRVLEDCFWFCELVCHLLSHFETVSGLVDEDQFLVEKLEFILRKATSTTLNLLKVRFFDMRFFSRLYDADFHVNVQKIIREPHFIDLDLLQFLFELFKKRNSDDSHIEIFASQSSDIGSISKFSSFTKNIQAVFHFEKLSEGEKVFVRAAEVLCQYITIRGYTESNPFQTVLASKIIDNLLKDCTIKKCSNFHLQLVLRVTYNFTKFDGISPYVLNGCLDLIFLIYNEKPKEPELNVTILQILKDFMDLVHMKGDEVTHLKYMKLIKEYKKLILSDKFCGLKVVTKYVECLTEMFKYDAEGSWTSLERNGQLYRAPEEILSFLKHEYHKVRVAAAQNVGYLFTGDKCTKESVIGWQKNMLKSLFKVLSENKISYPREKKCVFEYATHVMSSASLISWAHVICLSSFWRKKALFNLLRLSSEKKFKLSEVNDILEVICKELKIRSPTHYLSYNFSYLYRRWAKKGLNIQDFPYYLLRCKTVDEFIRNHLMNLVAVYAEIGQFDMITTISVQLKKPVPEILKECLPVFVSYSLISLSSSKVDAEVTLKVQRLQRLAGDIKSSEALMTLDKVIFYLIKNMHDPSYLGELCTFFGNIKDDRSPLGFEGSLIMYSLESICTSEGKPLMEKLALEIPSIVEKVLSLLQEGLEEADIYEDKVLAFYKYIFFVDLISKISSKNLRYFAINSFIIRDVIYTIMAIIKKDEGEILTEMACGCLRKIGEAYLPKFDTILGEFLPAIASVLTPLVLNFNQKALGVLNFLICENYSKLEKYITFLDPFPSRELFHEINEQIKKNQMRNLKGTIKNFIKAGNNKNPGCRIEGLKYLRKSLSEKKDELKEMYENLTRLRGFSEDCKKSLIHQLICMLVDLTFNENTTVRSEAAKCLGELGPSNLTTLVLKPESNFTVFEKSDSATNTLFMSTLKILSDLLTSDDYAIKKASSKALYAILSVREAKEKMLETSKDFENLVPFISSSNEALRLVIRQDYFMEKLNDFNLWKPSCHEKWIVDLVECLLQSVSDSNGIMNSFRNLIQVHWPFAENLLVPLLNLLVSSAEGNCQKIINKNICAFFESNFSHTSKSPGRLNKRSVRCLLDFIDFVRMQQCQEGVDFQSFLTVNYIHVAKAALYCSAYFTSILYTELWFEQKRKTGYTYTYVDINTICEVFPEEGSAITEILRECHSKIGNLDGIHGCGYMHILNSSTEIQHYEHVNNWKLSLLHHDVQLSMGNRNFEEGLMNSLEHSGMYYVLRSMINENNNYGKVKSIQYKCAAHLSDWSLLDSTYKTMGDSSFDCFDKRYYFALKAFHFEDDVGFLDEIHNARKSVLNELRLCNLESSKNLYLSLSKLQSLKEVEEFALTFQNANRKDLINLYDKWCKQDSIKYSEFKLIESVLTKRATFLKIALKKADGQYLREDLLSILCETYCTLIEAAREEKQYESAIRTISYLDNLQSVPTIISEKLKIEKARILWERGDREIGRFLLNHFIKKNKITGELKSKGLRLYGDWMAQRKSENSREIIQNYYLKSIAQTDDSVLLIDSYASIAKFADSNYEQLNEYLSSPLFEIKQNLISTQQGLALELRQELGRNHNREKRIAYLLAAKQCAIDENEIKNNRAERDSYLNLALRYYLYSLKEGEKYNLLVFRIVSMWMSNSNNPEVIQLLKKLLHLVPTYKFLCLLPQLIPRMTDVSLISDLIERILQDHPHHTLPVLFALSNAYEDLKYNDSKATYSTPRVQAAKSILDKFRTHEQLHGLIHEMGKFSAALIELANHDPHVKGQSGYPIDFPDYLKIKQIKNFSSVPIPSLVIPYEKSGTYSNIISVHKFEDRYYLVGGLNLPKRIRCIGSDGISRSLLVKGKDDLRQDAVMQQVFTIMNSLLRQNTETKKRKLIIRTYKVVPLSQRSGVIEWCENTQPLSLYLIGPNGQSGAHKTYHPNDILAVECRSMIKNVFARPLSTNEDKLKVFLEICEKFHPAFHYFFIENFPAAGVWFERRLAYIHSVATSSMIGYVLGIGDRHVHNILIDNSTAEVIHIDLGIAFEQGKTLPTPETVPFRLTRDIVDGMGLSGVEGDFRISCIKTMEVLRDNQDTILTLLEVLLYDPLYTWTITTEKAYSMQGHTETSSATTDKSSPDLEINKMAERALIKLKQKLQGTETGCMATNVEGQVNCLLQQARDPNNLCRLFHGWQAYL